MSLSINVNTPANVPRGLNALNAAANQAADDKAELRQAFDNFVGETFYSEMLKSVHKLHGKPAYFHGGRAEELFQTQLDQIWATEMTKASAHTLTGPMFELFTLGRG